MVSPFTAALWTYGRRSCGSPWTTLFTLMLTLQWVLAVFRLWRVVNVQSEDLMWLPIFALPCAWIAFHLRQLLADTQARLLPGGVRAQLMAAAVVAMAYFGVILIMLSATNYPKLPSAAIVTVSCAIAFHSAVYPALLALLIVSMSLLPTGVLTPFSKWLTHTPSAPWLLLAIGLAWFIVAFWQLSRMRVATPWVKDPFSQPYPSESSLRSRWLAFWNPPGQAVRAAISAQRRSGLIKRSRRWDLGFASSWRVLLFALPMLSIALLMSRWIPVSSPILVMSLMFAMIFTAQSYHQMFWKCRAADILKPVTREQFILELGICFGISLLRNVLIMIAALAVTLLLIQRPLRASSDYALAFSSVLLLAIFAFGSYVWVFRHRQLTLMLPALMWPTLVWLLPAMLVCIGIMDNHRAFLLPIGFAVSVLLALAGVYLARDAYRRWLVADLG